MTDSFVIKIIDKNEVIDLTPYVEQSSLSFKSIDPGGYASVQFDLDRDVDARDFQDFADVMVYDAETGEQVGGGRLLQPGRGVGPDGKGVWKMGCLGEGPAALQERTLPYHLIDSTPGLWWSGGSTSSTREWVVDSAPDNESIVGLRFKMNGPTVGVNAFTNANYYSLEEFDAAELGAFSITHREGRNSANNELEFQIRNTGGGTFDVVVQTWSTAIRTVTRQVGNDWSNSDTWQRMNLVYVRRNTTLTVDDLDWIIAYDFRIQSSRHGRDRVRQLGPNSYPNSYVLAHEAVIDSLARYCPRVDLLHARIDETATFQHIQLMWPEGINSYDVLEYLMNVEPAFTWAMWERGDNGLFRFEWRARDLTPRYVLDAEVDNFDFTGGSNSLISVEWFSGTNVLGRLQTESASDIDLTLEARGIVPTVTKRADIQLSGWDWDDVALEQGLADIEDSKLRAATATAATDRRILDLFTGRMVKPFQVLPGYLAIVMNARSPKTTLNAGEDDLASVFRVVSNDYSAGSQTSRLELNSYTITELQAIAGLLRANGGV